MSKEEKAKNQTTDSTIRKEPSQSLDLRGLMCPEPVLMTKKVLDEKPVGPVEVLVDSEVNVMNLTRLANSLGFSLSSKKNTDGYQVLIGADGSDIGTAGARHSHDPSNRNLKTERANNSRGQSEANTQKTTVVFIAKDTFGEGDRDFSVNLINVFLQTILQAGHKPQAILLANTGVRLLDPENTTSKVLNDFRASGVDVFACGLCVDFYGLKDQIEKEQITNMYAICEYLFSADKIISP